MAAWIAWRTPHARDTELTTTTFVIIVGTVNPAPGMGATDLDPPALFLGVPESRLDFLLGM